MAEQPSATPPEMSAEPTPSQDPDPIAVRSPLETEDVPPAFANLFYVEGSKDAMTVNFFYMSPTKISRILASANPEQFGRRLDGVIRIPSEPVARVALSMSNASNLMVELYRAIVFSTPSIRDELLARARDAIADIDRLAERQEPFAATEEDAGEEGSK